MKELSRRETVLLGFLGALALPKAAAAAAAGKGPAFLDKFKRDKFMQRDDIDKAVKSYYMSYDCTSPYPHKFNEVVVKWQLRTLQFHIDHGTEKELVEHYMTTMAPLLQRLQAQVAQEGPEKGLTGMFDGPACQYQVFERIDIAPGARSFPCPYKELLGYCKEYLKTFQIAWEDVCSKWCTPTWKGCAERIGIDITIQIGDTCTVKLVQSEPQTTEG